MWDGKATGSVVAGVAVSAFCFFTGTGAMDDQGWAYHCPSAYTFLTATEFIEIQPNTNSDPESGPVIGTGEPDGRRVYHECKAKANKFAVGSAVALFAGLCGAVYLATRPTLPKSP